MMLLPLLVLTFPLERELKAFSASSCLDFLTICSFLAERVPTPVEAGTQPALPLRLIAVYVAIPHYGATIPCCFIQWLRFRRVVPYFWEIQVFVAPFLSNASISVR